VDGRSLRRRLRRLPCRRRQQRAEFDSSEYRRVAKDRGLRFYRPKVSHFGILGPIFHVVFFAREVGIFVESGLAIAVRLRFTLLLYCLVMLNETLEQGQRLTDVALDRLIPLETEHPVSIHKAMRHSVFAGGKRLRPVLSMEAGRMVAGSLPKAIEELGAALEMLHTYSLIHDDLPALDNDDLRRGRPTCHKVFGEALAILSGDALQTQAYEVLSRLNCPPEARVNIIEEIARGTGTVNGMIGGQVVDLEAEHTKPTAEMLEYIHRSKTAALITASLVSGGLYAGAKDGEVAHLRAFGMGIGLAFQIVDDVLDVTQTSEQLGKTAGKDTASEKATYPALFGIEASERKADALVNEAFAELENFGERADTLKELARYLVERKK
jgi:geranylgeranyl diphosphate synthase type II